jgi:hypothetical protein
LAAFACSVAMLKEIRDARIDQVDVQLFMGHVVVRPATDSQSIGAIRGGEGL